MAAKRKVFDTCILPILTYRCQTWALISKHQPKPATCRRGMERSLLEFSLRDNMRAINIKNTTK